MAGLDPASTSAYVKPTAAIHGLLSTMYQPAPNAKYTTAASRTAQTFTVTSMLSSPSEPTGRVGHRHHAALGGSVPVGRGDGDRRIGPRDHAARRSERPSCPAGAPRRRGRRETPLPRPARAARRASLSQTLRVIPFLNRRPTRTAAEPGDRHARHRPARRQAPEVPPDRPRPLPDRTWRPARVGRDGRAVRGARLLGPWRGRLSSDRRRPASRSEEHTS